MPAASDMPALLPERTRFKSTSFAAHNDPDVNLPQPGIASRQAGPGGATAFYNFGLPGA